MKYSSIVGVSPGFRARQQDLKRSTFACFAGNLDGPMETPNDAMHYSKPEAAARKLGGEERVKDLGLRFRRHAATRVGDFQLHVIANGQRLRDRLRLPYGYVPSG